MPREKGLSLELRSWMEGEAVGGNKYREEIAGDYGVSWGRP